MQSAEGLSDRKLADAGFDTAVLVEFRARLIACEAEQLLLDTLLACYRER